MTDQRVRASSLKAVRALPALHTHAQVHLLANTLSLVGALLHRRPEAAEDLLAQMAAYLRGQIAGPRPLVPLAEELRLALTFVGVERARMGGRLRLEVACTPESLAMLVPPLVLQPLVENAIRHGIACRPAGGRVCILARVTGTVLHLAVVDDGAGLRRPLASSRQAGWGLVGIRLRLAALWGSAARLRVLALAGGGTLAAISLPVVATSPRGGDANPRGADTRPAGDAKPRAGNAPPRDALGS